VAKLMRCLVSDAAKSRFRARWPCSAARQAG
jgi:hypothetical protein